jgi:antitoxin YefM
MTILNISLPESIQAFVAQQDETEYLLSTEANRYQLMTAIQNIETKTNLVSFTPEEWNEEYNICSRSV